MWQVCMYVWQKSRVLYAVVQRWHTELEICWAIRRSLKSPVRNILFVLIVDRGTFLS